MGDSFGDPGRRRRPSNGGGVVAVLVLVAIVAAGYVVTRVIDMPAWWPW